MEDIIYMCFIKSHACELDGFLNIRCLFIKYGNFGKENIMNVCHGSFLIAANIVHALSTSNRWNSENYNTAVLYVFFQ